MTDLDEPLTSFVEIVWVFRMGHISRELKRLNIDIAALQETRLPSNGSLKEEDYTFF